ncbi:MAG: ORF6C domain-containing protein [Carnobacterium inhibens]|uniref:ORF6C domain-containing protein n=1 Tax=Carnobacterium sp. TaxID=48221 RepID=UPI0033162894
MSNLQIFNFDSQNVRTQIINNDPWFVAIDVCNILDIKNPSDAIKRLDDDERSRLNLGRQGEANIVNEFGLYSLVLSSRKPEAKSFKRWITHEVIPSIRETGSYQTPMSQEDIMIATLENQKEIKRRLADVSDDVESLKNEVDLSRLQKSKLSKLVRANSMAAVGGKKSAAYSELYRVAISEHWREVKNYFEVASYEEIPKLRFDEAMEIATMWTPSLELAMNIKHLNSQSETEV